MTAATALDNLVKHAGDKPTSLARLAALLLAKGESQRALDLCAQALALAPHDAEVQVLAAEVLSHKVPMWHFSIVQDSARNKAYESALRHAIKPDSCVLEIGTGSGLFAMMAARAGARQVVTCERHPVIAAAAREIVARNGFTERVQVIAKDAADLEVGFGRDLDEPADLLVMEPFRANIVGGGLLQTIEQAGRRLLKSGAQIIAARAATCIALAEYRDHKEIGMIEGFDLSPFNRLAIPCYNISVGSERLLIQSQSEVLFNFDFQSGGPFPENRTSVELRSSGDGLVNGIVQWVHIETDEKERYENKPSVGTISAYSVVFYPLRRPLHMKIGDKLTVCGAHDRHSLRLWVAAPEGL